jgi:hypothetical protein
MKEIIAKFQVSIERSIDEKKRPTLCIRAVPSPGYGYQSVGFDQIANTHIDLEGAGWTRKLTAEMTRHARVSFIRELAKRWGISIAVRRPKGGW